MFDADDGAQMVNQFDTTHEPVDHVGIQKGGVMILKARVSHKVFDLGRTGRVHRDHLVAAHEKRFRQMGTQKTCAAGN